MITKNQAPLLWANNYRLVARDNKNFTITELHPEGMWIKSDSGHSGFIKYKRIGVDYFILARPLSDLTKEIAHEGEKFVPFNELEKIFEFDFNGDGFTFDIDGCIVYTSYSDTEGFFFSSHFWDNFYNQLRSWHFNIGFPEGSVKPLKD